MWYYCFGFIDELGTIYLRCRHGLGGRGQKFAKFANGRGVKNREKFADVLNGWSLSLFTFADLSFVKK